MGALDYATTNGNGQGCSAGREGHVGGTAEDNRRLSKRSLRFRNWLSVGPDRQAVLIRREAAAASPAAGAVGFGNGLAPLAGLPAVAVG